MICTFPICLTPLMTFFFFLVYSICHVEHQHLNDGTENDLILLQGLLLQTHLKGEFFPSLLDTIQDGTYDISGFPEITKKSLVTLVLRTSKYSNTNLM